MTALRVLVADEHTTVRTVVVRLLERWGMTVVGVAADSDEALACADSCRVDVIVFDFDTRRGDGLQAVRRIKRAFPDVPLVVHSLCDEPQYRAAVYESGADGFASKAGPSIDLERVLRAVTSVGLA